MKRFLNSLCFFVHLIIIAVMEFAIVVYITNYIAEKINYHGVFNVFILLAVAILWFASYIAFIRETERRK